MRVVAVCLAGSLLFNPALVQSSDFGQKANDEDKYSASLVVAPLAKSPKYLKYQDGRQQVIYSTESEYPAEDVLSFISEELKKRGWKPLPQDFFNPDIPSSHQRGWTFFEDHTQQPWTGVYAWNADWENGSHDIVVYVLRYESPDNSTRNLKNLQVIALFIPADKATKMRRDATNKPQQRFPRERINELADLLSAHYGAVTISVHDPDSTTNEDASNLLAAFAKAKWNTSGVNQEVYGTEIGSDGLLISDPVGIHIYSISQRFDNAMFVKEALKYFGVDSVLEIDLKLSDGRLSIVVGRPETSTKPDTSRSR
jgi:hypothetical protein